MSQPDQKQTTPGAMAVDAVLVLGFFIYIYNVVKVHVPSTNPNQIMFWGAATAACMSGVFWLALQMGRVVLKAQLAAKKK